MRREEGAGWGWLWNGGKGEKGGSPKKKGK